MCVHWETTRKQKNIYCTPSAGKLNLKICMEFSLSWSKKEGVNWICLEGFSPSLFLSSCPRNLVSCFDTRSMCRLLCFCSGFAQSLLVCSTGVIKDKHCDSRRVRHFLFTPYSKRSEQVWQVSKSIKKHQKASKNINKHWKNQKEFTSIKKRRKSHKKRW